MRNFISVILCTWSVPVRDVEIVTESGEKENPVIQNGKMILILSETETMWLLSIDSKYSMDDIEDVNKVKADNELYAQLTSGKALERKRSAAETQTPQSIEKSKGTMTTEIIKVDSFVNASAWDLYDTYAELVGDEKDFQTLIDTVLKAKGVGFSPAAFFSKKSHESQIKNLFKQEDFRYALLVTERLLASNVYQTRQSAFKKTLKSKYDDIEPTTFKYKAYELWTYQREFKESKSFAVTAMDWNSLNPDLLAVGYGDLTTESKCFGKVCVWSPKNPVHPEREFTFEDCVTALSYSRVRPSVLAVGCRNGDVLVADTSADDGYVRVLGRDKIKSRHGPVWRIQWFINKRLFKRSEELLSVGEGGLLIRFSFPDDKETDSLLKLSYVSSITESHLRPRKVNVSNDYREVSKVTKTFVKHSFSGLWFSTDSNGNFCYISTKEGAVLKAVLINNCRVVDIFSAHVGPVYYVEHSPFTDLIYLTCGADWSIRIWMEGIIEPLFTLKMQNPVKSAKWFPNVATLIGAVAGADFAMWDIAKNVFLPANITSFDGPHFSKLDFSPRGSNVVLGDENGLIRVLHLCEFPRQPFLQKEALVDAIERGLFNNEELLKKFKRTVASNKKALTTEIVV